jgi:hypothetical protein
MPDESCFHLVRNLPIEGLSWSISVCISTWSSYIFVPSSPNFSPFYSATSRSALTTYLVVPSKHFSDERSHSLELDRAGGLGGNVVDNAANATRNQDLANGQNRLERDVGRENVPMNLVDNPVHDTLQEVPREVEGLGRHVVGRGDSAEDNNLSPIRESLYQKDK